MPTDREREKLVEEMLSTAASVRCAAMTGPAYSDYQIELTAMSAALAVAEKAIRADEREACAKMLESMAEDVQDHGQADPQKRVFFVTGLAQGADAIRELMEQANAG